MWLPGTMEAQSLDLNIGAEGPGAVVVRCPPPYIAGQGLILQAQPLLNARFAHWEDGSTSAERYLVIDAKTTQFTAYFEDLNATTYLATLGWEGFDPSAGAQVQYPTEANRTRLSFNLSARRTYQVFRATDIASGYFSQVPFAVSATGPLSVTQRTAEAGPVNVWVASAANPSQAYYRIRLDGNSTYPSLFFAQSSSAPAGTPVMLYGEGLSGSVTAWSGSNAVSATGINDHMVQVIMPTTPGSNFFTVAVNGQVALGGVAIQVRTDSGQFPLLSGSSSLPQESGGLLEVSGSGLTPESRFFLDGRPVATLSVSSSGTSAVVQLPPQVSGARQLTVVNQGAISSALIVNLRAESYLYSPATTKGTRVYTWEPYQPNAYTFSPATEQGVRVFTWAPNQPNAYSFSPATSTGVRVLTWAPYQPGTYAYSPATVQGVQVYTWAPYQPGAYTYFPSTTQGVRVHAP